MEHGRLFVIFVCLLCSSVRSFGRSFVRSWVCAFLRSFARSFGSLLARSLVRWFVVSSAFCVAAFLSEYIGDYPDIIWVQIGYRLGQCSI